jgi:hypothetical protein
MASCILPRIAPQPSSTETIHEEAALSSESSGLSGETGFRLARAASASPFTGRRNGFRSENTEKRTRLGCSCRTTLATGSENRLRTTGAAKVR